MEASKYALQAGQEVDIYLRVSGLTGAAGDSLSAFDVDLLFDPAVFQMTGFRFEDRTTGANQLDFPEAGALPFAGHVLASAGVLDAYGVSGNSDAVLDAQQPAAFDFLTITL